MSKSKADFGWPKMVSCLLTESLQPFVLDTTNFVVKTFNAWPDVLVKVTDGSIFVEAKPFPNCQLFVLFSKLVLLYVTTKGVHPALGVKIKFATGLPNTCVMPLLEPIQPNAFVVDNVIVKVKSAVPALVKVCGGFVALEIGDPSP